MCALMETSDKGQLITLRRRAIRSNADHNNGSSGNNNNNTIAPSPKELCDYMTECEYAAKVGSLGSRKQLNVAIRRRLAEGSPKTTMSTAEATPIATTTTTTATTTASTTVPQAQAESDTLRASYRPVSVGAGKRSLSESSVDEFQQRRVVVALTANSEQQQQQQQRPKQRPNMWRNELSVRAHSRAPQPLSAGSQRVSPRHRPRTEPFCQARRLSDLMDVAVRLIIVVVFVYLERRTPFHRRIAIEELWLYKNPRTEDIVSVEVLLVGVLVVPFLVTVLMWLVRRDCRDFRAANWTWTLAVCLNGIATSLVKVCAGRPRPDFYYRCFPNGSTPGLLGNDSLDLSKCTGAARAISEGFKSFPSGHASFAFTSLGFISFYVGAKLHTFTARGRGETWRLMITLAPLMLAALVAISRTCDYHHHYQDVVVGSVIGLFITYMSYRQYYPSIFAANAHCPLSRRGNALVAASAGGSAHSYRRLGNGQRHEEDSDGAADEGHEADEDDEEEDDDDAGGATTKSDGYADAADVRASDQMHRKRQQHIDCGMIFSATNNERKSSRDVDAAANTIDSGGGGDKRNNNKWI